MSQGPEAREPKAVIAIFLHRRLAGLGATECSQFPVEEGFDRLGKDPGGNSVEPTGFIPGLARLPVAFEGEAPLGSSEDQTLHPLG